MMSGKELGKGLVNPLNVCLKCAAMVLLAVSALSAAANSDGGSGSPHEQYRIAEATADAFNDAIARGDSAMARALLMPGVLIYESGSAESSADEYYKQHLPSDIEFMAGMKTERLSRTSGGDRTTSWIATRSHLRGQYKGKAVDLDTTETLILALTDAGWRIAHIHWSSSTHRGGTNTH